MTCNDRTMASITFHGDPVSTVGELPAVGSTAPAFDLVGADLAPVTSQSLAGRRVVLDESGKVVYTEQVPEVGQEPDYDAAVAALS